MHTKMIQSFNNGTLSPLIYPLNFTASWFSFILCLKGYSPSYLRRTVQPLSSEGGRHKLSWCLIRWLFVGARSEILGRAGGTVEFCLRIQSSVSGNTWVFSTVGITQLYFDMKAFVTVILAHWDLHKEMECPCFATPGFTVSAIYPVELLDMQSF